MDEATDQLGALRGVVSSFSRLFVLVKSTLCVSVHPRILFRSSSTGSLTE